MRSCRPLSHVTATYQKPSAPFRADKIGGEPARRRFAVHASPQRLFFVFPPRVLSHAIPVTTERGNDLPFQRFKTAKMSYEVDGMKTDHSRHTTSSLEKYTFDALGSPNLPTRHLRCRLPVSQSSLRTTPKNERR